MTVARLMLPLGLALLAACTTSPSKQHTVTLEEQSDCPARLQVGQTLILSLPSNPTTGYRWQVRQTASQVLRSLGPEVYSNPEDAGVVGSAGVSTWRFQAQSAGEDELVLVYQQPWAPEVLPVETFGCKVSVK